MEIEATCMVEAAGKIIHKSGITSLSIESMGAEMKIDHSLLYPYFAKNEDILMLLLLSLDNEINQVIKDTRCWGGPPEEELKFLFESIHKLFEIKPYYLPVIFSSQLIERNTGLQNTLIRIKISVRAYLLEIIDQGKNETTFKNLMSSKSLVNQILKSFRSFMNEQRLVTKMVSDIENLKPIKNQDYQSNSNQ
jgi:hypothetical protein